MIDPVEVAARNNAAWCDSLCRTHGVNGVFGVDHWASAVRTPQLYPDAITLTRDASAGALLRSVDRSSGCSVKDSFANLDLTPAGFRVLFDAQWIQRAPALPPARDHATWSVVGTGEDLAAWERGRCDGGAAPDTFAAALLEVDAVIVFGERAERGFGAGVIANRSDGVVGISNFFARADRARAWEQCVATVSHAFPDTPIVGYETGTDLEQARRQGFEMLGPLRVWLAP